MELVLATPDADGLAVGVDVLRGWQRDDLPLQLHPGDLGWAGQVGVVATAAAVRTWSEEGTVVALALRDSPGVLRLTVAPARRRDVEVAQRVVDDLERPERGVLPAGPVAVEAPNGTLVQDLLGERGWSAGEPWSPLVRDLAPPVPDPGLRVRLVGAERAAAWVAVHRSAFPASRLSAERWRAVASGPAYAGARCLLGEDEHGTAVAAATVWSAGPGRPGLLEPLGVHREHRHRGHGRAMSLAAAAALRSMGSSSAMVCTPSANVAAVATYVAAGFVLQPERRDRARSG